MPGKRKYIGCKVEGCNAPHGSLGYCHRHSMQIRKSGKIVVRNYEVNQPNETIDYGDYTGIILRNRYGEFVGEAIIDSSRKEEVLKYKWHKTNKGYVARRNTEKPGLFFLHWQIIERQHGMIVDHINGNSLDNRIKNLRLCTNQENAFNSKTSKNSTSGVHGVSFHKGTGKWRAYINHNRKQISLGLFEDIKDAEKARIDAEVKHYQGFSPTISRGSIKNESAIYHSTPRRAHNG